MEYISLGADCSVAYQLRIHNLRRTAYPFDWCKCKINQLLDALKCKLTNFETIEIVKLSVNHPKLDFEISDTKTSAEDETEKNTSSSYIVKNIFGMTLAHELTSSTQLPIYQSRIIERIIRFNKLLDDVSSASNSIKIHFIRKEFEKINSSYKKKLLELVEILRISNETYLTIICHYDSGYPILKDLHLEIPNLRIIYFKEFEADWRCPNLDWTTIFAWKVFPEPLVL